MNAKQMAEKARLTDRFGETVGYFFAEETVTLEIFCTQLCKEQRQLVADELKRYSEDLSIPNQYKINDLCMDAPTPEL